MPGGQPPRVLALGSQIALIVCDVPADIYAGGAIESRLSDLDWVAACGTAHHAVADDIVQKHTVVPFRLFTLFSSDEKAVAALRRRVRAIETALERVSGKHEWLLKVTKPEGAGSAKGAEGATGAVTGTSFLQQKAAAKQAAAETARRVIADAAAIYGRLAAMASDARFRDVGGTALLLDASFLVPTRKLPAFKAAVAAGATGLLAAGCRVSLTGPWPPYSFVALESEAARG